MTSQQPDANRLECSACGWVSIPPEGVEVVFHPCRPARSRRRLRRVTLPPVATSREDFLNPIYGALATQVDDSELLRRTDEDDGE